jgi:UDP-N-acetylglucosamine 4,6-dehydratase
MIGVEMDSNFKDKNIVITGGTGAFGGKFVSYLSKHSPKSVCVLSRDEMKHAAMKRVFSDKTKFSWLNYQIGDINRNEDLERAFLKADVVIHAAAMKHLGECESNPDASNYVNVNGTQNVIKHFHKSNAQTLIFLSSDKSPYASSVYGAQKYMGEKLISDSSRYSEDKRSYSLRYSNVLDSTGAVFLIFANMLNVGKKVTVNGTQTIRGFVSQAEVISVLENCMACLKGGETVVLKPRVIRIAELATAMKEIIGKGEVEIKESTAFLGEKDNATLIMAEELGVAKEFPEANSYMLDYSSQHPERERTSLTQSFTLDDCPVITGKELKEYLSEVIKSNNIL